MDIPKYLYWMATTILTAIMLYSIYHYFLNHDGIAGRFVYFGYPGYLVYPLAIAKTLGLTAIWGNFSRSIKEWAYAGFFFNTLLAVLAHYITDGNGYFLPVVALCCTLISYFTGKTIRP